MNANLPPADESREQWRVDFDGDPYRKWLVGIWIPAGSKVFIRRRFRWLPVWLMRWKWFRVVEVTPLPHYTDADQLQAWREERG